jgi:hypothetical protein
MCKIVILDFFHQLNYNVSRAGGSKAGRGSETCVFCHFRLVVPGPDLRLAQPGGQAGFLLSSPFYLMPEADPSFRLII